MIVLFGEGKGNYVDECGNTVPTEEEEMAMKRKETIKQASQGYASMNRERVTSRWLQLTAKAVKASKSEQAQTRIVAENNKK